MPSTDHQEHGRAPAPAANPDGSRASATDLRLPDFFIVGHAKSGTTALYEMLRGHPQIFMPSMKEPWFFASDMRPRFQPRRAGVPPQTLEQYAALFAAAGPDQRAGEASSSYLWSRTAAGAIAQACPRARIIAILREPTSFLRSLHLQLLSSYVEGEQDFQRAIELEGERREGRRIPRRSHRPQLLQYADHVRYVEQLRRYEALFGREQMLVLIYDDFRADNEGTVRTVERFIGVDDGLPIEVLEVNPSSRVRLQQLDDLVHRVSTGRGAVGRVGRAVAKAVIPRPLQSRALQLTRRRIIQAAPRPVSEEFVRTLRRRFKPEVVALSEHLGRDLVALWGYDRVD